MDKGKCSPYADSKPMLLIDTKSTTTEDVTILDDYDSFDTDEDTDDDVKKVTFHIQRLCNLKKRIKPNRMTAALMLAIPVYRNRLLTPVKSIHSCRKSRILALYQKV